MRLLACVLAASGALWLAGCGSDTPAGPSGVIQNAPAQTGDEKKQLATLLTEFADTGSPASMNAYFAGAKVSAGEHKRYVALAYEFEGEPEVSGTTATGKVKVKSQEGKDVGTKDWTFVKEGDKWKLKTAPLP